MAGSPVSLMQLIQQLNNTDRFYVSQGQTLADNKAILWEDLLALIQQSSQSSVVQSIQTSNYTNNNASDAVIPNMNVVLTEGKYLITFDASGHSGGSICDMTFTLLYNTNSAITSWNASDVAITGSARNATFTASNHSMHIGTTGEILTVPAGGSYIVKVNCIEASGNQYTIENRVLTALKVF